MTVEPGCWVAASSSQAKLAFLSQKEGRKPLSAIAGLVVMSIIMVLTIEQALASLELDRLVRHARHARGTTG